MADTDDLIHRLRDLTLTEKCQMVSGDDAWSVPGCDRLDIPGWRVSDTDERAIAHSSAAQLETIATT